MGERTNILLKNDSIYLYAHWTPANEMFGVVKRALIRGKSRWDDSQYLNRIIFSEMIRDEVLGLTGYGLSSSIGDGQVVITIDIDKQTVNNVSFDKFISD